MSAAKLPNATLIGYPRIGANRELKKLEEAYWAKKISQAEFLAQSKDLRNDQRKRLVELGLAEPYAISESFSYYDQVLDTALAVSAVPERFGELDPKELDTLFTLARGSDTQSPLELTKWFDTNYHYLVPEIASEQQFKANSARLVELFEEAKDAGIITRPQLIGPITFLALSKAEAASPFEKLPELLAVYAEILQNLHEASAEWVQLDEPCLAADQNISAEELQSLTKQAYTYLTNLNERPQILVTTGYGEALDYLNSLKAVEAVHLNLHHAQLPSKEQISELTGTTLVAGVIDGRSPWKAELSTAAAKIEALKALNAGAVAVTTSVSLQHVPYSLAAESGLSSELKACLAFAEEKVQEIIELASGEVEAGSITGPVSVERKIEGAYSQAVRERTAALTEADARREDPAQRREAQADIKYPALPTTTIGSFPQTAEVRKLRADHRTGKLADEGYEAGLRAEIKRVIELQEELGLDVLVHGEAERNDMVQYFAENFAGFATTKNGWVQSYGSRCTRPSILYGDVSRPKAFTVPYISYAQSLTQKPVKGMLTGPVTILAWSFVRDDQPLSQTANQVALALADEIADLEAAGIRIIQVDEPALRELLPLRKAEQEEYLDWSVKSFRYATSQVAAKTQIHTHLCYSEFETVLGAIDALDADVASIESARSHGEIVQQIDPEKYSNALGPGVWDIHSPRVPSVAEIEADLLKALGVLGAQKLWSNPDCGLKTRGYEETRASLVNLVAATKKVRAQL